MLERMIRAGVDLFRLNSAHLDHETMRAEVEAVRARMRTAAEVIGATIVGGCCDMYPEHIEALANSFATVD